MSRRRDGLARRYQKDGALLGFDLDVWARDDVAPRKEETLHCVVCQHLITRADADTTVDGKHLHTFTNPLGVTYEIGCFREAMGCRPEGPASFEFTWFPGYAWQIQRCASCGLHMGWLFQRSSGDEGAFFGLIRTQLVALESGD